MNKAKKCSVCNKDAIWISTVKKENYCDKHFPFYYEQLIEVHESQEPPK